MVRRIIIAVAIFFLSAWHNLLCAQPAEPIGTISFIEGICDIVHNGRASVLISEREPVYVNDRVRTKSYSKLEITFDDKSVLKLAPESCVVIEEYNLGEQKRREHSRIQLTRGKIEAIVSKTGAPDTFLIETPNAKGAVKGSDVFISYLGSRTGVFVQAGAISILNPSIPDVTAKVVKGNSVLVNFNEAPGEVRPIRDAELTYFKRSVEPAFIKKWIPTKGAAQMKGIIVSLTGTVRLYKKGARDWRKPKLNETVSEGDKLQTEEQATLKICLSNGNTITLQPFTEMVFDTLRYDSATGNYENTLAVTKGRLSAVVERTTKQLTFQVKTPTSVCGVRGTFVEVVVTPPAQAQAKAATQVFFEGGGGYVTSLITGLTQEIGAGQNAIVDNLGKISAPMVTPPEQRNLILQAWTFAQTMDNYSTAEGGAGTGSTAQQQTPPPPPPSPIQEMRGGGIEKLVSLANDIKKYTDIISTLTFEELNLQVLYNQTIPFDSGSSWINVANFDLTILQNGTWSGTTSGTWSGTIPEAWDAYFYDETTGDSLLLWVTSSDDAWSGTVSGSTGSLDPNVTFDGDISGTATETAPDEGTFQGTGSGTWEEYTCD
jgi:hypothetical protein